MRVNNIFDADITSVLNESNKDFSGDYKYSYTVDELRNTLLGAKDVTDYDGEFTDEEYKKFIDDELKGIDKIVSEVELKNIKQYNNDSYPGFKGGKVKTILQDGRQFVFIPDEYNDELSLIYAVELVLSSEVPEDQRTNEAEGISGNTTDADEIVLKESGEFDAVEFEKSIPHSMRWKEYDYVGDNGLYWVTQEPFSLEELNQFAEAFKNTEFSKAYVTVRNLSHYDFQRDFDNDVLAYVTKNGSINSDGYWAAAQQWFEKDESEKITENFGDTTDYSNKIESCIREYWEQLEDKKLFDAIADIEIEVESTDDEFRKPLAYNVDIATMRKGLNDRADKIGAYVADRIPSIGYVGYKDTKILDTDFGSDTTLRFTQDQSMPDFGDHIFDSEKLKEDEDPARFGTYQPGDLVQIQDAFTNKYYGKFEVVGELDPDKSAEKYGRAVIGYELKTIEPEMFAGETTESNNYRMKPYLTNESEVLDEDDEETFAEWFDKWYPETHEVEDNDTAYPFANYIKTFPDAKCLADATAKDIADNAANFDEVYPVESMDREYAFIFASDKLGIDYDELADKYYNESEDITESEILDEDAENILDDETESKINKLISDIKTLQSNLKHSIEDEMISINARIEELNRKLKYGVDELNTDDMYFNTSDVIEDLKYLVKESNWAKEDEVTNESEEHSESREEIINRAHEEELSAIETYNDILEKIGEDDEALVEMINEIKKDEEDHELLLKHYIETGEALTDDYLENLKGSEDNQEDITEASENSSKSAVDYLNEIVEIYDTEGSIDQDIMLYNIDSAMDLLGNGYFDEVLDKLQFIKNTIEEEGSVDQEKAYDTISECIKILNGESNDEIDIAGFDKGKELEKLHEEVDVKDLPTIGDKYKNTNGAIIVVAEPTNEGKPQFNIASSEDNYNNGKFECRGTDSYESLDKILKHNMYSKVEE